jgi:hypothetical protein
MPIVAGWVLLGMGLLHTIVFGMEAVPIIDHWARGGLWSLEHLQPFGDQSRDLLLSNAVFWATFGSAAGPLAILGALILTLARQGLAVPRFVGWSLMAWALATSAIMQPSGFPLALVAGAALVFSRRPNPPSVAHGIDAGDGMPLDRKDDDPLAHPDIARMGPAQLADLPFDRPVPDGGAARAARHSVPPAARPDA